MILVDTSIWIAFFRGARVASSLTTLLEVGDVLSHPWIIGELALGNLGSSRRKILADLGRLPTCPALADAHVLDLVETRSLAGTGIGWADAHLLAAALSQEARLWSADGSLDAAAKRCGVGFPDDR